MIMSVSCSAVPVVAGVVKEVRWAGFPRVNRAPTGRRGYFRVSARIQHRFRAPREGRTTATDTVPLALGDAGHSKPCGLGRGGPTGGGIQFREHSGNMVIDGLGRDEQLRGDLGVGASVADQVENLTLALGQP